MDKTQKIKKRKAIKALRMSKSFESYYSGGKFQVTQEGSFAALFQARIKFFNLQSEEVLFEFGYQEEEIVNFEYY